MQCLQSKGYIINDYIQRQQAENQERHYRSLLDPTYIQWQQAENQERHYRSLSDNCDYHPSTQFKHLNCQAARS